MLPWAPMYWGDYSKDTAELSMLEHGAYVQLIAHYHNKGEPIPANASVLHRVCRCTNATEEQAVVSILGRYFHLEGDTYRHNRIERELAKCKQISEVRRNAARKRHRANAPASDMHKHMHLHTQSQSQSHIEEEPKTLVPPKDKHGTRIPSGFKVSEEVRQFAQENHLPDPDLHIAEFIDYWTAIAGSRGIKLNWDATFRNWLRRAKTFNHGAGNGKNGSSRGNTESHQPSVQHQRAFNNIAAVAAVIGRSYPVANGQRGALMDNSGAANGTGQAARPSAARAQTLDGEVKGIS